MCLNWYSAIVVPEEATVKKEQDEAACRESETRPSTGCNSNGNTEEAMTHSSWRSQ